MVGTAADVTVQGLGRAVAVSFAGPRTHEVRDAFCAAWSRCLVPDATEPADRVTLTLDEEPQPAEPAEREVRADSLGPLLQSATQSITSALIRANAGRLLMFHAVAVSQPATGASLVLVAPGGTGKTTFARTFGRTYGYLSDETVGIDGARRILPYQKPLSVRVTEQSHKSELSPDEVGLAHAPADPWVAKVVLIRRDPTPAGPTVESLDLLDAIAQLTPETSSLSRLDRGLHVLADVIEATGGVQLWRYHEATDLRPLVEDALGGRP